ncbi:MAG: DUF3189 family protein [Bacillota bacterium]
MKIFYLCPTGLHTALVAAGIHVGRLSPDRPPSEYEMHKLFREFRRLDYVLGKPVFVGIDEKGHEVFTVGVAAEHKMMKKAVEDVFDRVYNSKPGDYLVVDAAHLATGWIRLGSFFAMHLNIKEVGEKMCVHGIRKRYGDLLEVVEQVKNRV